MVQLLYLPCGLTGPLSNQTFLKIFQLEQQEMKNIQKNGKTEGENTIYYKLFLAEALDLINKVLIPELLNLSLSLSACKDIPPYGGGEGATIATAGFLFILF